MTSKRIATIIVAALALTGTTVAIMSLRKRPAGNGDGTVNAAPVREEARPTDRIAGVPAPAVSGKRASAANLRRNTRKTAAENDSEQDDMPPADRRLLEAIENGMDDDSLEQIVKLIPDVSASTNAEVRSELVDALGWFGVSAMNHLLPFMADANDDVRQSAIDNWTSALGDVEDEKARAKLVSAVMQVLNDEDALDSMAMELTDMDEKVAIQALVDVIESGKAPQKAVAAAREQYEFLTGDEYTTIEAADQWLTENYEPSGADGNQAGNK